VPDEPRHTKNIKGELELGHVTRVHQHRQPSTHRRRDRADGDGSGDGYGYGYGDGSGDGSGYGSGYG